MKEKCYNTLTILISIMALCLSIYTNCKHDKLLVEEKQIDAMVELVEYIQNKQIALYMTANVMTNPNQGDSVKIATLFELLDTIYRQEIDDYSLIFVVGENTPLNLNDFIFNPLIPKEVSDILRDFVVRDSEYRYDFAPPIDHAILVENYSKLDSIGRPHVTTPDEVISRHKIDNYSEEKPFHYYTLDSPAFSNFGNFKRSNKKLYDTINKWFDKHGMDNVRLQ